MNRHTIYDETWVPCEDGIRCGHDTGPLIAEFYDIETDPITSLAHNTTKRERLAASAPELLEALEALNETVESLFEGLEIVALVPGELRKRTGQARAAIAKAKGD